MKYKSLFIYLVFMLLGTLIYAQSGNPNNKLNTFTLGDKDFLLNGKPFQIRAGEIHPNRIPKIYWRQRIQMAKAMGLNTVASYIFWNYFETEEGKFDFTSENRDMAEFFKIVQEEGMFLFLRPGPYCCAEYDFGALPLYLLKYPDIRIRCMDPRYTWAVERYVTELAKIVKNYQITNGGPIFMLQIENEYGSYGNDRDYLNWLMQLWRKNGIDIPFSTGDGPTNYMLDAGALPGCAVGLDSGSEEAHWELAYKMNPGVPVFSSETYPGWLTHWGEKWAKVSTDDIVKEVDFLMKNKKSFSLYVFHGGTNFGFTAGANAFADKNLPVGITHNFMPDVTSYDYDAPLTEQGRVTEKYLALRKLIQHYLKNEKLPDIPSEIPAITIPEIKMEYFTSIWDHLPKPVRVSQPQPMEYLNQYHGMIMYRTSLVGHKSGKLVLRELHDYALVYVDGKFIGTIDRRLNQNSIEIPKTEAKNPVLEIFVQEMGHINFAEFMIDRKGITERAVLNGMTLMNWEVFQFPMDEKWIVSLEKSQTNHNKQLNFFKGSFRIDQVADTYFDMSNFKKGYVWVNGHNLGHFWEIGPQKRLYCPAEWLKKDLNEIIVFDLLNNAAYPISTAASL
ncbi:MAG: beta-galactosidase [Bacteroidales bacterium]